MRYKTVDGRRYPAPNAKVDAFLNLRMSQRFHFNNSDFLGFNEVEQELDKVEKELELCEIELPESANVIEWLISTEGFDKVSRLYQRALDECTEDNNAGMPNQANVSESKPRKGRLPKKEDEILRIKMLAILREHPTMKDNPQKLAQDVGVSEASIRRWITEEDQKFREKMKVNCNSD